MNTYEKEHLARLRPLLSECMVLLRKDGSFPLEEPCAIALYGNGARHTIKGGTGSGEVNSRFFVTVEEGLKEAGFVLTTNAWLDAYDAVLEKKQEEFVQSIRARARKKHTLAVLEGMGAAMPSPEYDLPLAEENTTAVYVLARTSGEGSDRTLAKGDYLLNDSEIRDILALNAKAERFMLVLNTGGPVDLSPVKDVKNILVLSQLGAETGAALADVLLGNSVPSGKLTATWAFAQDLPEIGTFGDPDDTYYREGIYVGYRYYDTAGIVNQYPFGYGLSYTDFAWKMQEMQLQDSQVSLQICVRNTGKYAGRETMQAYASLPEGKLDQPLQVLAAFAKISLLQPQEEETITLQFDLQDLASYDSERGCYILEAGDYGIYAGTSSVQVTCCGIIHVPSEKIHAYVPHICTAKEIKDAVIPHAVKRCHEEGVMEFVLSSWTVKEESRYEAPVISEFIKERTPEELAMICTGAFQSKNGSLSIIGSASSKVAGAAGETTHLFEESGMPSIVMADGPAGLRLSQKYMLEDGRVIPIGDTMPATVKALLPKAVRFLMDRMQKEPAVSTEIHEQYATAIPIGTAIAQSFDSSLAEVCGDIVGEEMERFHVDVWLAPALNIQRDPRCGRNFEYYSEDPLLSGKMAAALTKGVQKHPGRCVTIKHYAANNQETSRYTSNSVVSERALREIYLRGFGICIREASPAAVMTSYNLINGTHTSESHDLTEAVLREEFGFDGIVMTDWVISLMPAGKSRHARADAARVMRAGGNLFMPGSQKDYEKIMKAMKEGRLSLERMQKNADGVYRFVQKITK